MTNAKWISVEDAMPHDHQTVLLHCDGCVLMGVCNTKLTNPFQSTYSGAQWPQGHHITHWMPLPEPPE